MKVDSDKAKLWLSEVGSLLPEFSKIVSNLQSPTLLIGASVMEFYALQGWIPPLSRKTGDVDLSVGIVSKTGVEYQHVKNLLLNLGYKSDPRMPYRFFPSSKIPGATAYLDLLAHPIASNASESAARKAMGVEESFSLKAFSFAQLKALVIQKNLFTPNPLGFIGLKIEAYQDEPLKRRKDFADIVELISGLVSNGLHFELPDIWKKVRDNSDSEKIFTVLSAIRDDSSSAWDLEDIQSEFSGRGLASRNPTEDQELFKRQIREFISVLEE